MRVLIVHNRYRPVAPSGENRVVDQESAALVERGHQVAMFERHSADIESWSRLRRSTLAARVLWSEDSRRSIARQVVSFAPDVVHVHNTFPLVTPSVLYACRELGVPIVTTLHNFRLGCARGETFRNGAVCHDCLDGSWAPALVHGCYRGSRAATVPIVAGMVLHSRAWRTMVSAYVFNSARQRDVLASVGLPRERSFVKDNLVAAPEPAGPLVTGGGGEPVVVYVGRLDEAKGLPFLMRAWDGFRRRRPTSPLRLELLGSGPLEAEVTRWGAAHASVTVAGLVSRDEVLRALAKARAAVLASQCEETFGLAAAEAMATGTAVVAPSRGAFPELVTPGRNGMLFPPTDEEALVEAFCDIEADPERWLLYGRQAQVTYQQRFTPDRVVDRLLEIYDFAMAHPLGDRVVGGGIAGRLDRSPT